MICWRNSRSWIA